MTQHKELKPGDVLNFVQKDGRSLVILVYEDGVRIKADAIRTGL